MDSLREDSKEGLVKDDEEKNSSKRIDSKFNLFYKSIGAKLI